MKKEFIGMLVFALILLLGGHSFYNSNLAPLTDSDYQYFMQNIGTDMKRQRLFSWQSLNKNEDSGIEIRKRGEQKSIFFASVMEPLPSVEGSNLWIYHVHADSLLPGVSYEYRIKIGKKSSDWQGFHTEPEEAAPFQVLLFGDSQSTDYGVWKDTVEGARKNHGGAAFFINLGDLVDNGQDQYQWNQWRKGAEALFREIPIAPVMGNHEAYSLDWKFAKPELYLSLFSLPKHDANLPSGFIYSFDYGDVHFAVLNTQLEELAEWYPKLYEEQANWLRRDLAQTPKKWKIVLMHRPLWRRGLLDKAGHAFLPILEEFQVDLVFNGHVHSYSRTFPLRNGIVDSKGITFISTGRSGDRTWPGSPPKPMDDVFYNPVDSPNYLVLDASNEKLTVRTYLANQNLIDQVELSKD